MHSKEERIIRLQHELSFLKSSVALQIKVSLRKENFKMAEWRKSRKWDRGTQERQEQGLRQLKKEGYWEPSRLELGFVHVLSGISEE